MLVRWSAFWSATFALLAPMAVAGIQPELQILPAKVSLTGAQAAQRLLVEARAGGQFAGDLSHDSAFGSSNPKVATVELQEGTVHAVGNGSAVVTARVQGRAASAQVTVTGVGAPFAWNFRNHVLPVLTKAGCNAGACHGAAAGKGGMKLSLRGFDPDADYAVLTRQASGRRVSPGDPAHSLFLLKPTMVLPHGGGQRIAPASRDYHVLAGWVAAGAPRPRPQDPRVQSLEVFPPLATLKPGDSQQIVVRAQYSDGHSEDVTRWVKFGSSDSSVATVDDMGRAKMTGSGEAAITVWFSSKVTFARVASPFAGAPSADAYAHADRVNFIDDFVLAKLQTLGIAPSAACTDAEFIRRASLDAAGILPTPAETQAFVAEASPDKRAWLIDRLLARPEFIDYWAYKWSDLFLVSSKNLSAPAMKEFYAYLRKSVADNKPWNQMAREIVTATGSNLDNGAASFFVMHKDPIDLTETTTQAFLGMPLMCARCHNHPLEKWTQRDYYQMANLFSRVRLKSGDRAGEVLVLSAAEGDISLPRLGAPLPPRPLDGEAMALDDPGDRRRKLADWLTAPENPYFAKALVNRVWRNFMGRGIVEAEDDVRLTNPPSNQELLDALAADFVKNGYDVRRLIRTIIDLRRLPAHRDALRQQREGRSLLLALHRSPPARRGDPGRALAGHRHPHRFCGLSEGHARAPATQFAGRLLLPHCVRAAGARAHLRLRAPAGAQRRAGPPPDERRYGQHEAPRVRRPDRSPAQGRCLRRPGPHRALHRRALPPPPTRSARRQRRS